MNFIDKESNMSTGLSSSQNTPSAPRINRRSCVVCGMSQYISGTTLFTFPKDKEKKLIWLHLTKKTELNDVDYKRFHCNARICSEHFHDWAFTNTFRTRLIKGAFPVLKHLPCLGTNPHRELEQIKSCVLKDTRDKSDSKVMSPFTELKLLSCDGTSSTGESPKQDAVSKSSARELETPFRQRLQIYLTPAQYQFVVSQINGRGTASNGKFWNSTEKHIAYGIYLRSPSTYESLIAKLAFPSVSFLEESEFQHDAALRMVLEEALVTDHSYSTCSNAAPITDGVPCKSETIREESPDILEVEVNPEDATLTIDSSEQISIDPDRASESPPTSTQTPQKQILIVPTEHFGKLKPAKFRNSLPISSQALKLIQQSPFRVLQPNNSQPGTENESADREYLLSLLPLFCSLNSKQKQEVQRKILEVFKDYQK